MKRVNWRIACVGLCFLVQYAFAACCLAFLLNMSVPQLPALCGSVIAVWLLGAGGCWAAARLDPVHAPLYQRIRLLSAFFYYLFIAVYVLFLAILGSRYNDLAPLRATIQYLLSLAQGRLGWQYVVQQMARHFLIYAPLGYFLPRLLPAAARPLRFALLMALLLAVNSAVMLALDCGVVVMDYLALSLLGSLAAYWITWALPRKKRARAAVRA